MKLLTTFRRPVHTSHSTTRGRLSSHGDVRPGGLRPAPRPTGTRCLPASRPALDAEDDLLLDMEMEMLARSGKATVVSVEPTDQTVDIGVMYDVTLLVQDAFGATTWEVRHRQLIAPAALASWIPGSELPVRYSPLDPTNVCIG